MMSIAPVSVQQGRHYYKQENYYTEGQDVANSAWFGAGAEELGLSGQVNAADFDQLLLGIDPGSGRGLSGKALSKDVKRRAAIDLTFSAPKSVSLAALLGGDGRLEQAHGKAVEAALRVAEERYSITRTGGADHRQREVTGNFIAARFQHDTSRAKDPQLHTHCVVMNAVRRGDGKWRSLANEGLYANSKLLGLIYQNELAREVQALGYAVKIMPKGTFEIEGYSDGQLQAFSKRREQIERLGATNQQEARTAVKINRPTKGREVPRCELLGRWGEEANEIDLRHPMTIKMDVIREEVVSHPELVEAATRHATERDVSFRREALERFALEARLGHVDFGELGREIAQAGIKRTIIEHSPGLYTTEAALATEEIMINLLRTGQGRFQPIVDVIPTDLSLNVKGFTAGQKEALELSVRSPDQFIAWQGVAGAGKTFAMNELREIAAAQGFEVKGFAPSAEAAKVLASESGLEAKTVAAFRPADSHGGRELWIIDEAGLLSARDASLLMERATQRDARIVFVGDTRQLSSVEAGNPFKLLQQNGISTAHMTESVRHRKAPEALRRATTEMAAGQMEGGLRLLEKDIVEYRRQSTRVRHVAADYLELSPADREKTLLLAGTNKERELLTKAIRTRLREKGELGDGVMVSTLVQRDLTREEILATTRLEPGNVLVFHKEYQLLGIERDAQLEVVGTEPQLQMVKVRRSSGEEMLITPRDSPAFKVYEARLQELAPGDQVRWTRNNWGQGLRNGQELRVLEIKDSTLALATRDGRRIDLQSDARHHLDHNYVNTVYASQGKTSDRVIISTDRTFAKEAMYVAVSRARLEAKLYTEDKEKMVQLAGISRAKVSAQELVAAPKPEIAQKIPEAGQRKIRPGGHSL